MSGFWTHLQDGSPVHVKGDPNMPEETLRAILNMAELARKQEEKLRHDFEQLWNSLGNIEKGDQDTAYKWFRDGYYLRDQRENEQEDGRETAV